MIELNYLLIRFKLISFHCKYLNHFVFKMQITLNELTRNSILYYEYCFII